MDWKRAGGGVKELVSLGAVVGAGAIEPIVWNFGDVETEIHLISGILIYERLNEMEIYLKFVTTVSDRFFEKRWGKTRPGRRPGKYAMPQSGITTCIKSSFLSCRSCDFHRPRLKASLTVQIIKCTSRVKMLVAAFCCSVFLSVSLECFVSSLCSMR
jgi:hypothetical protein